MDFKELIKKVGFELAVVIAQKNLPIGFWEELTFNECFSVYRKTPSGSELRKTALEQLRAIYNS